MNDMVTQQEVVTEKFTYAQIGEAYFDTFYSRTVFRSDGTEAPYQSVGLQARAAFVGAFVKYKQRLDDEILCKTITHDNILADMTKSVKPKNYEDTVAATLNMLAIGVEGGIRDKEMPVEVQKVLLKKVGKLEVSKAEEGKSWLGKNWGKVAAGLGLLSLGTMNYQLHQNGVEAAADAAATRGTMVENTQAVTGAVGAVEDATMEASENVASQVLVSGQDVTAAQAKTTQAARATAKNTDRTADFLETQAALKAAADSAAAAGVTNAVTPTAP